MLLKPLSLAMLMATASAAFADDVLLQAERLLAQQKPGEAVQLLAPLEDDRAGDPDYDYLLGQALLESGDASNAVFAFERCLTAQPENGPCRVQMARTHLAMGETANARAELETIEAYNPPPQVRELVSKFLGAVTTREKQEKRQLGAWVQAGLGHDTNANSATDATQIAIPNGAGGVVVFPLPAQNRSMESAFATFMTGGNFIYRHTPKVTSYGDLGLNVRSYIDESKFSYNTLDGGLGAGYRLPVGEIRGRLSAQKMWLDGEAYRNMTGLSVQYQRDIGMNAQLALFLQDNLMRYDTQGARDSDRMTGGLAWSSSLEGAYSPVYYLSAYAGGDNTKSKAQVSAQHANDFTGIRAGGSLTFSRLLRLTGSLSHEKRDYDAPQMTGGMIREDGQTDLALGLAWQLKPKLVLQPGYTYTDNGSNITMYDFKRHIISIDLRYDM